MELEKLRNVGLHTAAAEYASKLRDEVRKKIVSTMELIDEEIKSNQDIYPYNSGKLNQRELCRRAMLHYQTLQQPAHKTTTLLEVKSWLESKLVKSKPEVKKAIADKIDFWQGEHQKVTTQICIYELEIAELAIQLRALEEQYETNIREKAKEISQLNDANLALRNQLNTFKNLQNITLLVPKKTNKKHEE